MFAMNHDWEKVKKENENLAAIEKKSEREVESIRQRLTELRRQLELKRSALPALQSDLDEKMSKKAEVEREAEIEMERMFPNRSVFITSETPQSVSDTFSETFLRSCKKCDKTFQFLTLPQQCYDDIQAQEQYIQRMTNVDASLVWDMRAIMDTIRTLFQKATALQRPTVSINIRLPYQSGVLYPYTICTVVSPHSLIAKIAVESTPPVEKQRAKPAKPAKPSKPAKTDDDDNVIPLNKSAKVFSDLTPSTLVANTVSSLSTVADDAHQIRNELRVGQATARES